MSYQYAPEDDYTVSACPICDRADCTFPPECQEQLGVWPERPYGDE